MSDYAKIEVERLYGTKTISANTLHKEIITKDKTYEPKIKMRDMKLFDCSIKQVEVPFKYGTSYVEVVFGLLNIHKKHDNVCIPRLSSKNISMDWLIKKNKIMTNIDAEFFKEELLRSNKRFYIIPLLFYPEKNIGHANIIIYDRIDNSFERFEPNGAEVYKIKEKDYEIIKLDLYLYNIYKEISELLHNDPKPKKFYSPVGSAIEGIQYIESMETVLDTTMNGIINPEGFCLSWSYYYADLRLKFSNMTRNDVFRDFMFNLTQTKSMLANTGKFIRHYANSIFLYTYKTIKNYYNVTKLLENSTDYIKIIDIYYELLQKIKKTNIIDDLKDFDELKKKISLLIVASDEIFFSIFSPIAT